MTTKYFTVKETAKLVRKALKANFPGRKFSVKMDGGSIRVTWVDGPSTTQVDAVVKIFEGTKFEAMTDLRSYKSHWMLQDGSFQAVQTQNNLGHLVKSERPEGAVEVNFHCEWVFTTRNLTPDVAQQIIDQIQTEWGFDFVPETFIDYKGFASLVEDRWEHACESNHYQKAVASFDAS